jgi:hypothetical protein
VSNRTVFTFLDRWIESIGSRKARSGSPPSGPEEQRSLHAQALALREAVKSLSFHVMHPKNEAASGAFTTVDQMSASIGIEVIGAQWHERVLDYAAKASRREARVDDFSVRLAGLAQNIFDFTHQDSEEVNDSLASAARIGTDITFVHRGAAVRFMEESRAFDDMRSVLGGSPYWLLVQLVLGHNEFLLSELGAEQVRLRQSQGLSGMVRELSVHSYMARGDEQDAMDRLQRRFLRRLRLAHYIPNIFRYPTERLLYDVSARSRGLEAQHDYITKLDETIEKSLESSAREAIAIGSRSFDIRLQLMLGAIAVLQVGGAFASLAAIWPPAGLWACLLQGTCAYTAAGSRVLLLLSVIATAFGLLLGVAVAIWLLNHRDARWSIRRAGPRPAV